MNDNFYDRVSGVFFLGCLHDEFSDRFGARVCWTILKEFDHVWRVSDSTSKRPVYSTHPLMELIESITTKFRKLNFAFPVWTYYEGVDTIYKHENRAVRQIMDYTDIVRPILSKLSP